MYRFCPCIYHHYEKFKVKFYIETTITNKYDNNVFYMFKIYYYRIYD